MRRCGGCARAVATRSWYCATFPCEHSKAIAMLPSKDKLTICFAHPAYQMAARFAARGTGIAHVQARNPEDYAAHLPDADVVVASMLWRNDLVPRAKRLRFVQSISAGTDQYDKDEFRAHGIRLPSTAGVHANPAAQHARAL